MTVTVAALVARARNGKLSVAGQHDAFAELVRRYEAAALEWSVQRLEDPEEAREATQDAFLAAWRKLAQLREPSAFGTWLKRLVATHCARRRRRERTVLDGVAPDPGGDPQAFAESRDRRRIIGTALATLYERDRDLVLRFYVLGQTLAEIAADLNIARGTAGKRLHAARLAIRRALPRAMRDELMRVRRSPRFVANVRKGLFDEYVGEYRFDRRPDLVVHIEREGDELVSYGGGQRHVLLSTRDNVLIPAAFDGEGRFSRDRAGRVTSLVYYEFGSRLGVARRVR